LFHRHCHNERNLWIGALGFGNQTYLTPTVISILTYRQSLFAHYTACKGESAMKQYVSPWAFGINVSEVLALPDKAIVGVAPQRLKRFGRV
jgi:hypothetical protein